MTLGKTLAALALAGLLGCQTPMSAPVSNSDAEAVTVATIAGEPITLHELDVFTKDELFQRQTRGGNPARVYDLHAAALQRLITQRVLEREAAARGISIEALLRTESQAQGPVSDAEVEAFRVANAAQLAQAPADGLDRRIRRHLEEQRAQQAVVALVTAAGVEILLERPRVDVAADGPSLGPDDATVTIVEFSDFQCPFCSRARPVVREVTKRYPSQVRFVYRHLPLDQLHPRARAAAEASACAEDQGHFWAYHDLLFDNSAALSDEDLLNYGSEVGADVGRFEACFAGGHHREKVQRDVEAATAAGISGTPAFIVNGVVLFGLPSFEALDAIVKAELENEG